MMNQGQPKKPEPVYEEKLSEMERKYGVIQEKIQVYDKFVQQLKDINDKLEFCQDNLRLHGDNFVNHRDRIDSVKMSMEKVQKDADAKQESISQRIYSIETLLDRMTKEHVATLGIISRSIDALNEKLNKLSSIVIDKDQMEGIMSHMLGQIERVENGKQPLVTDIQKLQLEMYKMGDAIKMMQLFPEKIEQRVSELQKALNDFNSVTEKRYDFLNDGISSTLKMHIKATDERLEMWKEAILGTPSSNQKVKEEIMQKLEMTQLDGANSVIKVNNVENQVKLLEKKLENLTLLLKKNGTV